MGRGIGVGEMFIVVMVCGGKLGTATDACLRTRLGRVLVYLQDITDVLELELKLGFESACRYECLSCLGVSWIFRTRRSTSGIWTPLLLSSRASLTIDAFYVPLIISGLWDVSGLLGTQRRGTLVKLRPRCFRTSV
jgi:hypothetical protein